VLAGGIALYLVGTVLILGGGCRSSRAVWPWPPPRCCSSSFRPVHSALLLAAVCVALALVGALRGSARSP
jgi:hypothetical protein